MSDSANEQDRSALDLDEWIAALPSEVAPPPQLLGRILTEVRAAEGPPAHPAGAVQNARWRVPYAVAATLLFAAVTLGVLEQPATPASPPAFAQVQPFAVAGMDAAQLVALRNDLHSSLALALDELAPDTRRVVIDNLARIDAARAEIDGALRDEPNNQLLQQMLFASYTNEISLLNEFTSLARSARRRTSL